MCYGWIMKNGAWSEHSNSLAEFTEQIQRATDKEVHSTLNAQPWLRPVVDGILMAKKARETVKA